MIKRQTKHLTINMIIRILNLFRLWSEEALKDFGYLLMIEYFYSES
jgi:hypothetical protein